MIKRGQKGFTLIELMIVVAILGILAAVAVPRFGNLINRAREGAAKGSLGAIRSSVSISYAQHEGTWPLTLGALVTDGLMESIPAINVSAVGSSSGTVTAATGEDYTSITADTGGWWYQPETGDVRVNSNANDSNGVAINTW